MRADAGQRCGPGSSQLRRKSPGCIRGATHRRAARSCPGQVDGHSQRGRRNQHSINTCAAACRLDRRLGVVGGWAGGRLASVPLYRCTAVPPDRQVNQRLLYAPRCEEQESQTRFDATLTAAESVICQTGCISLAAYLARREPLQTPWHPMRGRRKPGQRQLASG